MDNQKKTYFIRPKPYRTATDSTTKTKTRAKNPLPKLPNEQDHNVDERWTAFNHAWDTQQQIIKQLVRFPKVDDIVAFVNKINTDTDRIPTGILLTGPDIANHRRIFDQLRASVDDSTVVFVSLNSHDCNSLKSALKQICIAIAGDQNDKLARFMDLDPLVDILNENESQRDMTRVVVLIEDAASFDGNVLAQLVKHLHSYTDRIPLRLLLNVATSIQVFQSKLPQWCIRLLRGVEFRAEQTDCIKILEKSLDTLFVSPEVYDFLTARMESVDAFLSGLKYSYMAYYYSRSVSQVRRYPSFRAHVEKLVESAAGGTSEEAISNGKYAERLLKDDQAVLREVEAARVHFEKYKETVFLYMTVAGEFSRLLDGSAKAPSRAELYRKIVCGEVVNGEFSLRSDEFTPELINQFYSFLQSELRAAQQAPKLPALDNTDIASIRSFLLEVHKPFQMESYKSLYLHEHFFMDNAGLLTQTLQPNFRAALETALAEPQITTPVEPHLASLYQLYRESPTVINTHDFYTAFHELVNSSADETQSLAWFLHAIAELKLMGFLKDSRRQYESLEKLLWKDL